MFRNISVPRTSKPFRLDEKNQINSLNNSPTASLRTKNTIEDEQSEESRSSCSTDEPQRASPPPRGIYACLLQAWPLSSPPSRAGGRNVRNYANWPNEKRRISLPPLPQTSRLRYNCIIMLDRVIGDRDPIPL